MSADKDLGVRYVPQTMDGRATMEQQLLLLARDAYRAWDGWCERDPEKLGEKPVDNGSYAPAQLVSERFNQAMRALYSQLRETDIFMSGVSQGRALPKSAPSLSPTPARCASSQESLPESNNQSETP